MKSAFERVTDALTAAGQRVQLRGDQASSTCPAHEDRNASLSISQNESGVLLHCHAGCHVDDVLKALGLARRDLFDDPMATSRGYDVVAEYPYHDANGVVLFVKERRWPKEFRQYRREPDGTRVYRLGDVQRVLYRLPEVQAAIAAGEPIYIGEGEKDADALTAAGVCGTTWPEGAWSNGQRVKWRNAYTQTLTGADVIIVQDKDDPGRQTASDIAAAISEAASSVRIVEAATGKDAADHLAEWGTVETLVPVSIPATEVAEPGSEGRGPSQATLLRRLALERYEFGAAADGTPFALPRIGPQVVRSFRGTRTGLRNELAALYAEKFGTVPSSSGLTDALTALEGIALATDPQPLAIRAGQHEGGLVLDLGRADGHAVQINAGRWRVVETSPVLFRRTALTGPLSDPDAEAPSFDPLRTRLNVADEDWPLVLAWLVAALMPDMPHPVLSVVGEQGTGKSTATELLVGVIDPSPAPLRSMPRDVEQWAVTASASWLVGLDNVSGVAPWFSDVLCRAVTGDGMVRRQLYSDGDVSVLAFRRVIIANGIDYGAVRGDLADRMLSLELHRITADQRRTAADVALSQDDGARVLAALLDLTAEVLAALPGVQLDEMPRMADFSRIIAAVDQILGTKALERYATQSADLASVVVASDPFAIAVIGFMEGLIIGSWKGTGDALGELLNPPDPRPRNWPTGAQAVNAALRRVAQPLRDAGGLDVDDSKDPRTRRVVWTIKRQIQEGEQPSQPSQASKPALTSDDAAKPERPTGFAPDRPGFATTPSAKPPTGGAKPHSAAGFAPRSASDQHISTAAKAAKAAKADSPNESGETI